MTMKKDDWKKTFEKLEPVLLGAGLDESHHGAGGTLHASK